MSVQTAATLASTTVQDDYRQAMRRLATTIAIITAGRDEDCTGMAATAVMSVTADPPSLMVAVNRSASLSPYLHQGELFCVNLLAEAHRDLVGDFSGKLKGRERFSRGDWQLGEEPPILRDAAASILCRRVGMNQVATHTVFIGEVIRVVNNARIEPLIWMDGDVARACRF